MNIGIGDGQFAPGYAVTREEITGDCVARRELTVNRTAAIYADDSRIGDTYKTAVTVMQQAGIMMDGGSRFNPKDSATRGEVAAMLHRYIKLTINRVTTQGWVKNATVQCLYCKDGKVLTGTQTIYGIKYFFNTDGTPKTVWVKDGDNWHFYSENKVAIGWLDIRDKCYNFTKDGLMVFGKWYSMVSLPKTLQWMASRSTKTV